MSLNRGVARMRLFLKDADFEALRGDSGMDVRIASEADSGLHSDVEPLADVAVARERDGDLSAFLAWPNPRASRARDRVLSIVGLRRGDFAVVEN